MIVGNRELRIIEVGCAVDDLLRLHCDLALWVAHRQDPLKHWFFEQFISLRCSDFGQSILEFVICPETRKCDLAAVIGGEHAILKALAGAGSLGDNIIAAERHRFPCAAIQIFQKKHSPSQRISVRILFCNSNASGSAVILAGDLDGVVMFGNRPGAGIVLI